MWNLCPAIPLLWLKNGRFMVFANQVYSYSPLEQQKDQTCLLKPEADELSQTRAISNHLIVSQMALYPLPGLIPETLHKVLHNIHLYEGVDAKASKLEALKSCNVSLRGLPLLMQDFSASSGAILQLWLPSVPREISNSFGRGGNVDKDMEVSSGCNPIKALVH